MVEEFKDNISFYIDNFNIELQLFKLQKINSTMSFLFCD